MVKISQAFSERGDARNIVYVVSRPTRFVDGVQDKQPVSIVDSHSL